MYLHILVLFSARVYLLAAAHLHLPPCSILGPRKQLTLPLEPMQAGPEVLGAVAGLWLAELTLPSSFAGLLTGEAEPWRACLSLSQPVPWGA